MNNQNEFEDLIRKFKLDDDSNAEQTGSPQEPQRRPAFNYEDDQRRYAQARSHAAAATAQRPAAQPAARPAASQAAPAGYHAQQPGTRPATVSGHTQRPTQPLGARPAPSRHGQHPAQPGARIQHRGTQPGGPPAAGTVRFVSISTTRLLMSRSRPALAEIRRTAAMAATITTTARPAVERGVGLRRLSCC